MGFDSFSSPKDGCHTFIYKRFLRIFFFKELFFVLLFQKNFAPVRNMSCIPESLSRQVNYVNTCRSFSPLDRMILKEDFRFGYYVSRVSHPRYSPLVSIQVIGNEIVHALSWSQLENTKWNSTPARIFLLFNFLFFIFF